MNINKLNNLIDGKKITKARVVKKTGISRPTLDSILLGNDFKVSNLEKIAEALNVKVGYFFDEEEKTEIRNAGRDYVEKGKIEHHGTENNAPSTAVNSDLEKENAELKKEIYETKQKLITAQEKIIELMEKL